jgi:sugar transferase EpsL
MVKRMIDVVVSAGALVVLAPLLLAIALLVGATLGRPILFRQLRPGRHGRPFALVKFRTMKESRRGAGIRSDAQRLTRLGRFLRAASLDELPELWNVLRGDMSLVGPRPLLMAYLDRYTPEQARRHDVRPGLTGWAQVNGRNTVGWEEKFALDVWYVDNRRFLLDVKILLMTVGRVLSASGISAEGAATMHEFMGSAAPRQENPEEPK